MILANHPRRTSEPAGNRRTHGSLQIDAQVVVLRPQCAGAGRRSLAASLLAAEREPILWLLPGACDPSEASRRRLHREERATRVPLPNPGTTLDGPSAEQQPPAGHAEYRPSRPAAQSGRGFVQLAVTMGRFSHKSENTCLPSTALCSGPSEQKRSLGFASLFRPAYPGFPVEVGCVEQRLAAFFGRKPHAWSW